jgi:hypothetical protein
LNETSGRSCKKRDSKAAGEDPKGKTAEPTDADEQRAEKPKKGTGGFNQWIR